eukprot:107363-Chlamydomonas_euryale.AAC.4
MYRFPPGDCVQFEQVCFQKLDPKSLLASWHARCDGRVLLQQQQLAGIDALLAHLTPPAARPFLLSCELLRSPISISSGGVAGARCRPPASYSGGLHEASTDWLQAGSGVACQHRRVLCCVEGAVARAGRGQSRAPLQREIKLPCGSRRETQHG